MRHAVVDFALIALKVDYLPYFDRPLQLEINKTEAWRRHPWIFGLFLALNREGKLVRTRYVNQSPLHSEGHVSVLVVERKGVFQDDSSAERLS